MSMIQAMRAQDMEGGGDRGGRRVIRIPRGDHEAISHIFHHHHHHEHGGGGGDALP